MATTAAFSTNENRAPSARNHNAPLSSRPPTYQSTASVSKRSAQNMNMPQQQHQPYLRPQAEQYQTGTFAGGDTHE